MTALRVLLIILCLLIAAAGCAPNSDAQVSVTNDNNSAQAEVELTPKISAGPQSSAMQASECTTPTSGRQMSEQEIRDEAVETILRGMTSEQKVGQLIVTNYNSAVAGEDAVALMREIAPGGIVFGEINFQSAEQTRKLVEDLNSYSDLPLIITVTEEGGRVSRATKNEMETTLLPSMFMIGQTGDPQLAYRAGQVLGTELMSLGVNLVLGPVADIWNNPKNTVIGDRSFGDDPQLVSKMVSAMVKGMRDAGIGTVLKHYPGHGGTLQDSHTEMTYSDSTLAQLRVGEFLPFVAGIEAGSDGVMSAHVVLPNVMEDEKPSTVSYLVLTEILREQLGFEGLIITDSMHMLGMANFAPVPKASVMAVQAGADILLVDQINLAQTFDALLAAVKSGEISQERLDDAVRRILMFKIEHGLFDETFVLANQQDVIGLQAHTDLVDEIESRAGGAQ